MTAPVPPCRCGCPRLAHTGNYGMADACSGACGCSFYEPSIDVEPAAVEAVPPGAQRVRVEPAEEVDMPVGALFWTPYGMVPGPVIV